MQYNYNEVSVQYHIFFLIIVSADYQSIIGLVNLQNIDQQQFWKSFFHQVII